MINIIWENQPCWALGELNGDQNTFCRALWCVMSPVGMCRWVDSHYMYFSLLILNMKGTTNDYEPDSLNLAGSKTDTRKQRQTPVLTSCQPWGEVVGQSCGSLAQPWQEPRPGFLFLLRNNTRHGPALLVQLSCFTHACIPPSALSARSWSLPQNHLAANCPCFCSSEQNLERAGKGQATDGSSLGGRDLGKPLLLGSGRWGKTGHADWCIYSTKSKHVSLAPMVWKWTWALSVSEDLFVRCVQKSEQEAEPHGHRLLAQTSVVESASVGLQPPCLSLTGRVAGHFISWL